MGTVTNVLAEHVTLRLGSVDRIGIGGYIPRLCHEGGLVQFLLARASLLGDRNIPSPALLARNHDRMIRDLDRFVDQHDLPVVRFRRGEVKELLARPHQQAAAAEGQSRVVLVGKAQERLQVWVGYQDSRSPLNVSRHPHFAFSRQTRVPDQWYFYLWDHDWGPAFIKLSPYAPYPAWIACNGHEWAKRVCHERTEVPM